MGINQRLSGLWTHACLTELTPSAPGLRPVIEPTMTINDADDDTAVPDSRSSSSRSSVKVSNSNGIIKVVVVV